MPERLRVVIAEDHYLVREGTRKLLEDSGEVEVEAAVGTTTELKDAVRRMHPDTVIADIRMPPGYHMEGIEAAHAIRDEPPDVGVVVLSQHADAAYALELLKNGSAGLAYLVKDRIGQIDSSPACKGPASARRSAVSVPMSTRASRPGASSPRRSRPWSPWPSSISRPA